MNFRKSIGFAILAIGLGFVACEKDTSTTAETYDFSEILTDYVDSTVLVTYGELKDNSITLESATAAFVASGSQADLEAACAAWRKARIPWEQSEAYLFGPASFQSLDPLLDSWPLDQAQLDQVLASNQNLSADYVRDGLGAVLRGFHTIEYLLFREGEARSAGQVTAREKEYLLAVTTVFRDDCIRLWALWHGSEGISGLEAEVLDYLEVDPGVGFGNEFKNAGKAGSRYVSQKDAVDEIIQGALDISDEVGNGKIAEPYNTKNPVLVESWFSWNSLEDFQNNMRSIEYALMGGRYKKGKALADFIRSKNPALATELQSKIDASIEAIGNIPEPFRNNLDKSTEIEAAMNAVNSLNSFITEKIKPLVE